MTITEQLYEALDRARPLAHEWTLKYAAERGGDIRPRHREIMGQIDSALAAYEASKDEPSLSDDLKSLHWHIVENTVNKEVLVRLIEDAIKKAKQ